VAEKLGTLEDPHLPSGLAERDPGRQPADAGADNQGCSSHGGAVRTV
jgi:hypothetical protein